MVPPRILADVEALRAEGLTVEVLEDGGVTFGVLLKGYTLAPGAWNRPATDVLVLVTAAHPNAKLDMFWVAPGLRLANGTVPKAGDSETMHFGRPWQRFSWHATQWNPGRDTILTYLREVVDHRLSLRE